MTPTESAIQYAKGVTSRKIVAGPYVRMACKRFLADLKRKRWPYRYDAEKADRAVQFMELLPHVKGKWASKGQQLKLEPWQKFIECNLFGWVHKKTGMRRFREAYEEIPRKNGKSSRVAARGVYMLVADKEAGAEIYSGATTEKQALEVFRPAWQMVHRLPELRDRFGIEQSGNAKNPGPIYLAHDMSRFEAIIGKPGDGSSPHVAIVDEYHEHADDGMVDTMQTGMGAREQPLLSIITTAGANLGGPCYEKRRDVIRVLENQVKDETIFGIIFGIDEGDAWDDPASLKKANPNFGVSVFEDFLLSQLAQARRSASKQNAFKTKHLNQWVGARAAWMNMLVWQRQKRALKLEEFAGCKCWIGVDLASKIDVAPLVMLFEREGQYHAIPRMFVPEAQVEENEDYRRFVTDGAMIQTPGDMIDFEFIEEELKRIAKAVGLRAIGFDPMQATYLITRLQKEGLPVFEYPQIVKNMSEPMKEVEAQCRAKALWHDGNPAMTWMMGNVVARVDAKDNIYPRKEAASDKIDGPVALIMAMGMALADQGPQQSVYERRGIIEIAI